MKAARLTPAAWAQVLGNWCVSSDRACASRVEACRAVAGRIVDCSVWDGIQLSKQQPMKHPFKSLPRRVRLDSCTAQTLRDYGGYATGRGRDAQGTRQELQRGPDDDFAASHVIGRLWCTSTSRRRQ